ncbi:Galactosylgalactosylxylosylprotein 3-beta-glucuronosyltransferase 2 [Physocladia obscura]|uniref:Galactosylgalactosylxylosylprotein 3-beta-glucuronosyltransferase 2 n=1 Tax=Physocladia obscura TaxID=109957 RepID=A0AAD5SW22_9FUNG|nr:Galactosylgalactosylxylosylprotein 3-beta-glucuronosyltransferase 2 [Physocladia obscura]
MVRLSQTLSHDKKIYWLVIEDRANCTMRIRWVLERSGLKFAHLSSQAPESSLPKEQREASLRNTALDVLLNAIVTTTTTSQGIAYFGDDDNSYDLRLFPALRATRRVSTFPVGFIANGRYERCIVDETTGKISRIASNWVENRAFPIDMGGFAIHTDLLRARRPRFAPASVPGYLESKFLEQVVGGVAEMEPLMESCSRVFVWHTQTVAGDKRNRIGVVGGDSEYEDISKLNSINSPYRTSYILQETFEHAFQDITQHVDTQPQQQQQWIFFVTPTYERPTQIADMVRLSQTLSHDPSIYWIVIEDRANCSMRVRWILERSGLHFAHLSVLSPKPQPPPDYTNKTIPPNSISRGVSQRNAALDLITAEKFTGVVYFGDDDNVYDTRLFNELRKTQRVAVFGVAFVGNGKYERCVVDAGGRVVALLSNWAAGRKFSMDMGGFAVHSRVLSLVPEDKVRPLPRFRSSVRKGFLETDFIEQIVDHVGQLEPLMDNCTRFYVWHVQTDVQNMMEKVESDDLYEDISALM